MAAHSDGWMRSLWGKVGGWLYGIVFQAGWRRWLLLAVSVVGFLVAFALLRSGVDYRRDPSALVPRSVYLYAETRELGTVLADIGAWGVWNRERLPAAVEGQGEPLVEELAGRIGQKVKGLGTHLPLTWLAGSGNAAICFAPADAGEGESWAIYLDYPDPAGALAAMRVEPGLKLAPVGGGNNVFELSGQDGGKLYFLAVAPWFIISSDEKLPRFAADSLDKPSYSLARAGVVAPWGRGLAIRGTVSPAYMLKQPTEAKAALSAMLGDWLAEKSRIAFSSTIAREGEADARLAGRALAEDVGGGGLWPLFKFLFGVAGILLLGLGIATVLAMLGWGGWLKTLALRSGIVPAAQPVEVELSEAFQEDAGLKPLSSPDGKEQGGEADAGGVSKAGKNEDGGSETAEDGASTPTVSK